MTIKELENKLLVIASGEHIMSQENWKNFLSTDKCNEEVAYYEEALKAEAASDLAQQILAAMVDKDSTDLDEEVMRCEEAMNREIIRRAYERATRRE